MASQRHSNNFIQIDTQGCKPLPRKVVEESSEDEDACSVPEAFHPQSRPGTSGSTRAVAAAARAAKLASFEAAYSNQLSIPSIHKDNQWSGVAPVKDPGNPASGLSAPTSSMAAMSLSEEDPEASSSFVATPSSACRRMAQTASSASPPLLSPSSFHSSSPAPYRQGAPPQSKLPQVPIQQPTRQPPPPPSHWAPPTSRQRAAAHSPDLLLEEEVEDEGGSLEHPVPAKQAAGPGPRPLMAAGSPLPPDSARAMGTVLWGSPNGLPPDTWQQGFFFCRKQGLRFGLVQLSGGPCGVLAAVQGHILTKLRKAGQLNLSPSNAEQEEALVEALADILWQARTKTAATLTLPAVEKGTDPSMLSYPQLVRSLVLLHASSKPALQVQLRSCLPYFTVETGWGIVLLLASLVLTRGVEVIRRDMDEESNPLSAMHGYCTQELVNLILIGQAVSNLFDGTQHLDGQQLRGIHCRSRIGFLSLFEWYKYMEVGNRLKNPDVPVWVVCAESHFTVLFAEDDSPLHNLLPFKLLYYDELANQDELITLTVQKDPQGGWTARVGASFGDRGGWEGQNIPPLECVIETRWPGVHVDWNGAEPIL